MRRVGGWALSLIAHVLLFGVPLPERPPVVPGKEVKKIPLLLLPAEGPASLASGSPTPPAAGKASEAGLSPPAAAKEKRASRRPAIPPEPKAAPPPVTPEPQISFPLEPTALPRPGEDSEATPLPFADKEAPERGDLLSSNRPASEREESLFPIERAGGTGGRPDATSSPGGEPGAGAAGSGPSAPGAAAEWEGYLASLRDRIEAARAYPERARRMGQEGRVTVRLVVGGDGKILEVEMAETSPFSLLNRAAVETIRSLSPLPPLPPGLGDRLEVTVPIAYHLDRSARR